jgi:hypothetical protein
MPPERVGEGGARAHLCIGFGPLRGTCTNMTTKHPFLWCDNCEATRRASLTEQFAAITDSFREGLDRG